MTTIGLVANDQLLQVTVNPKISSGEVNTVSIHVDFSDEWNNFGKNAVFYTSYNGRDIYEIVMANDECIVPSEVMKKSGTLYIGIRGVNSEKNEVKTTSLVKLKISEGAPTGNSTEVEPTPDVYQQLLTAYANMSNKSDVLSARLDSVSATRIKEPEQVKFTEFILTEGTKSIDGEITFLSNGIYTKISGYIHCIFEERNYAGNVPIGYGHYEKVLTVPEELSLLEYCGDDFSSDIRPVDYKGWAIRDNNFYIDTPKISQDGEESYFYIETDYLPLTYPYSSSDLAFEVADARVDNDGNTYESLGAIIRQSLKKDPDVDKELKDIRVGADGKIYESAGEAVRSQINEVNADITSIKGDLVDLALNTNTSLILEKINGYIDKSLEIRESNRSVVFIVNAVPNIKYTLNVTVGENNDAYALAEFDHFPQIGDISPNGIYDVHTKTLTITASKNAKYIAFCKALVTDRSAYDLKAHYKNEQIYPNKRYIVKDFIDSKGLSLDYPNGISDSYCKLSYKIPTNRFNKMKTVLPVLSDNSSFRYGLFFYDIDDNPIYEYFNDAFGGRDNANDYVRPIDIFIPHNAVSFRTFAWSDAFSNEKGIDNTVWYEFSNEPDYENRKLPLNGFVENAVKRARQFVGVKWSPVSDLPRYCLENGNYSEEASDSMHFLGKFSAGKEYTGIPYSFSGRNSYAEDFGVFALALGFNVPFETFITSTKYGNSFLYEHSINSVNVNAFPYGGDCMSVVSYAYGWEYSDTIFSRVPSLCRNLGNITSFNYDTLMVGDILKTGGHILMITDIIKDNDSVFVEVCEGTATGCANNTIIDSEFGGINRRKLFGLDELKDWFRLYTIYRVIDTKNVKYQPIEYAQKNDEYCFKPIEYLPCIPYMGNKFSFKYGYIPSYAKKVLIGSKGYSKLVVLKDNKAFGEYTISSDTEYIEVDFSEVGTYTAYLQGIANDDSAISYKCEWYVIN